MPISSVIVCSVLLLFSAKITLSREASKRSNYDSYDVQQTFARLLKSLVRVNEERFHALQKISQLQDYMLTKNKLKPDDDSYDSLEYELVDPPKRRTEADILTREKNHKLVSNNNRFRRRRQIIKQSCLDQSFDVCVYVCAKSVANVCIKYNCNTQLDNDLDIRTECYNNCQSILVNEKK